MRGQSRTLGDRLPGGEGHEGTARPAGEHEGTDYLALNNNGRAEAAKWTNEREALAPALLAALDGATTVLCGEFVQKTKILQRDLLPERVSE
jgi:hypothetical protein